MHASGAEAMHGENDEELGKRELDPKYTRGYAHIPHLRDKLPWLYSLHPTVDSQKKLARALRVSPAQLSTWLNGVRYSDARTSAAVNPDSIPIKHFQSFVDIWGVPAEILEVTDLAEFRSAIQHFEGGRGAWDKLLRAVPDDDDAIEIIPESSSRGIVDPDDEEEAGLPRFPVGERIMLRVAAHGYSHGTMLEHDRAGWASLWPNQRWPATEIAAELVFPRQLPERPPRFARLEGAGLHRIFVILTAEALPAPVLELLLRRPIDMSSLNYAATVLQDRLAAVPDKCRLLSRRFFAATSA
jgi:transcriptional regulator with XRE-family HTH domain